MSRFGRYEVVEELYRTPLAVVSRAKLDGAGEGKYVVKVFAPQLVSDAARGPAEEAFLERAAVQQKAAQAARRSHWAPVHEVGRAEDTAYYVTDYYPLTARKLIAGRARLAAPELHSIIRAAVAGLIELRDSCGRPHGSLKPSNVMISSRGDMTATRIVLCDPATAAEAASGGEAEDLESLGRLIHELVLQRPFKSPGGWPLEPSEEWSRLGRRGDAWRDLCNRLLDPTRQQQPADLAAVSAALARLNLRSRGRKIVLAGALVVALVGAGGFGGYQYWIKRETDIALRERNSAITWLTPLQVALEDPARRAAWETDPQLRGVVDELRRAKEAGLSFDAEPATDSGALEELKAEAQTARTLRQALLEKPTRLETTLANLRQTYEARGWLKPAEFVHARVEALQHARQTPGKSLVPAIDEALEVEKSIAAAAPLEQEWKDLEAKLATLRASGDATLIAFADALQRDAAAGVTVNGDALEGAQAVRDAVALAADWAKPASEWPAYHAAEFSAAVRAEGGAATPTVLRRWLDQLEDFRRVKGADLPAVKDLRKDFQTLIEDLATAPAPPPDKASVRTGDQNTLDEQIKGLEESDFARRDTTAGAEKLSARLAEARKSLDRFRQDWQPEDPQEWLASTQALNVSGVSEPFEAAIQAKWAAWREMLAARIPTDAGGEKISYGDFQKLKAQTNEIRASLQSLNEALLPVPEILPPAYQKLAQQERERRLMILLGQVPPHADGTAPPASDEAAGFKAWLDELRQLEADFALQSDLLRPGEGPDLAAWRKKPFWNEQVAALVEPQVKRIEALEAVNAEVKALQLAAIARDTAQTPECVLTAWTKLQEVRNWPAGAMEFRAEGAIRARLKEALSKAKDTERAAAAMKALSDSGPKLWRRFVDSAEGTALPDALAAATEAAGAFGVELKDGLAARGSETLSREARFNLLLHAAKNKAAKLDEKSARAIAQSISSLVTEFKLAPKVSTLNASLADLDWQPPTPQVTGTIDSAKPSLKLAVAGAPLEFVRVTPKQSSGAVYLCRTEVSLGTFRAMLAEKKVSPRALLPAGAETMAWPRAWQRGDEALRAANYWIGGDTDGDGVADYAAGLAPALKPEDFNQFRLMELGGTNPQDEHPMQALSATAAMYVAGLYNLRLPSADEFSAALEMQGADVGVNLRDATWDIQRAHIAGAGQNGQAGPWPDRGAFAPRDGNVAREGSARAWQTAAGPLNDGILYFDVVASARSGGRFYHLVGNVAEYVFDDPRAIDDLKPQEKASPALVEDLLKKTPGGLRVMGGSALSAPELHEPTALLDRADFAKSLPAASPASFYADVGFRLAFSAPRGTVAQRLQKALAAQDYLAHPNQRAGVDPE